MRFGLFGKGAGRDAAEKAALAEAAGRIKELMRDLLELGPDVAIAVNEIICADPACPGTETVILVMALGRKTEAFKAECGMVDLTRDVLAAVLGARD